MLVVYEISSGKSSSQSTSIFKREFHQSQVCITAPTLGLNVLLRPLRKDELQRGSSSDSEVDDLYLGGNILSLGGKPEKKKKKKVNESWSARRRELLSSYQNVS